MIRICKNAPFFNYFLGIYSLKEIYSDKLKIASAKICQFAIINIDNLHWIVFIWRKCDELIIFDSLNGELLPTKSEIKNMVHNHIDVNIKLTLFIYGKNNLQNKDFLTCGEHCLYFIYYEILYFLKYGYIDMLYVNSMIKHCKLHRISTDKFVWEEIYRKLKLAKPPCLIDVLLWKSNSKNDLR